MLTEQQLTDMAVKAIPMQPANQQMLEGLNWTFYVNHLRIAYVQGVRDLIATRDLYERVEIDVNDLPKGEVLCFEGDWQYYGELISIGATEYCRVGQFGTTLVTHYLCPVNSK